MIKKIKIIFPLLIFIFTQAGAYEGYVPAAGVKLYFTTQGQGPVMVVVHGGPGLSHNYLLPGMAKLAEKYQVTFYDQRGSGKSIPTALNEKNINIQQFILDLETLRKNLKLEKIILVGHSWGGILAMQYAIQYPSNISALILMNSVPATSKGTHAFEEELNKRFVPINKELSVLQKQMNAHPGEPQYVTNYLRAMMKTYFYHSEDIKKLTLIFTPESAKNIFKIDAIFTRNFLNKPYNIRSQLKKLHIPTLVVHGDVDPIPVWTAREIANNIPNGHLVVIKQCGHFPYIEQPAILFPLIYDFLGKHTEPSKTINN